ncbi:hypothetical protein [Aeromicrobium sp.]|uniref:hypothetical protein n=1 Tax=Aeromicrobium sp. TaxID=1871063 RepID=UPI003C3DE5F6
MKRTLAAAITLLLMAAGCGSGPSDSKQDTPATVSTTTAAAPAPEPTGTTTTVPDVVDYGDDEVTVAQPDDTARLTGAPDDFTAFIRRELARQRASKDDVCTEEPEIHVARVDPSGWAAGGTFIPQCGGNAVLWAKVAGTWKEVWAGQTLPDCATLKKYRFPAAIAQKTCTQGDEEIPFVP